VQQNRTSRIATTLVAVACCAWLAAPITSAAGAVRPGDDLPGSQPVERFLASGAGNESATDVAVQPDGGVVVALLDDSEVDRRIVRLLPDGSLDPAFGNGGVWHVPSTSAAVVRSVAIAADGRIVWAGEDASRPAIVVGRLTSAGVADPTFSGDGVHVSVTAAGSEPLVSEVLVEPDGRVAVAGVLRVPPRGDELVLGRLRADGSDDPQFAGTPFTTFGSHVEGEDDAFGGIARLEGGAYVVAARRFLGAPTVWRVSATGSALISANVAVPGDLDVPRAVVATDATHAVLVLAGATGVRPGLVRLDVAGTPTVDATGTTDGSVRPLPASFRPHAAVRQPDGRFVIAGVDDGEAGELRRAIARVDADGSLDETFGQGGIRRLPGATSHGFYQSLHAMAFAGDGSIVSAWHVRGDALRKTAVRRIVGRLARVRVEVAAPTGGVVGQVSTFTVRASNAGPDAAGVGSVAFRVGDELDVVSMRGTGCVVDGAVGRCRVDALAAGATREVLVRVRASSAGERFVSASISSEVFDDDAGDDTALAAAMFVAPPVASRPTVAPAAPVRRLTVTMQRISGFGGRVLRGCGGIARPCVYARGARGAAPRAAFVRIGVRPAPRGSGQQLTRFVLQERVRGRWITRAQPAVVVRRAGGTDVRVPSAWRARSGAWRMRAQAVVPRGARSAASSWIYLRVR
jgi:uncharacterized delta-60 repeat protein